ncbi:5-methyltetrahydrofolate--homocysteine methyltransferase [Desulfitispora alkaliphila]|uniref:homocysteine S-methyltransferase family protein n=1 Tax=Desulfitispora alkaliphila TaxID=622674 RepID=UPI003D1B5214
MELFKDKQFLVFDGAMGTMLQEAGLEPGELPELYNLEHSEKIAQIHKSYVAAGADIVTTNTFQANQLKLQDCSYSVEEVIKKGVALAKSSNAKWVALDIGPIGKMLEPLGEVSFQQAYEIFKRQVIAGREAGADLILIETISDLYEAKAAVLAAKENSSLPVICTMTFQEDGRTFVGTDPQTATIVLQGLGVDCLGINCSLGPEEMLPLVKTVLQYAKVPVIVQSNAGLPKLEGDETVFPVGSQEFGAYAQELVKLGVQLIGGCCGTTPQHIEEVKKVITRAIPAERRVKPVTCVASATKTATINQVAVIGERINPTGKKRMKEALRNNQLDFILAEAIDQTKAGADILDVNVGLPEVDECEMLEKIVKEIQGVVDTPLQIDSSNPEAIEAAVRVYNGKPIINSVNGKKEWMEKIFPIAKKYGAALIGLTLDEKGIPETAEERLAIAEKILKGAESYGIAKEDLIIDCLVMTASAQQKMVEETIKAVALVKRELGLKTALGVSNVSFGLPNRELINRTFLAATLGAGLNAPIIDPLSKEMMDTIAAFKVLNNQDQEAEEFIKKITQNISQHNQEAKVQGEKGLDELIIEGRQGEVEERVIKMLVDHKPLHIIDNYFIPTLDKIGQSYERKELFLPQLLRSAEAVKKGLEVIKMKALQDLNSSNKEKILLATVQGDIHDIGKNIAKMLLENYGFNVIDLGKDVPIETIVEKAMEHDVKLIGLSALMTTTVRNMEITIKALKKKMPNCKIMVGGAVLTPQYAQTIGADFYAADGQAGIKIAKEVYK